MRTFNIYSLSDFQINDAALWTIVSMLYITPLGLLHLIRGNFYLLAVLPVSPTTYYPAIAITNLVSVSIEFSLLL